MDWIKDIVNYEELPKTKIWVSIQFGKADFYRNHTAFAERSIVIVFPTLETAEHFIANWDRNKMNDYREACIEDDYMFWTIYPCPKGYYADYINMYKPVTV